MKKRGKALLQVVDSKGGVQQITIRNCLIAPQFPYKLLAVQAFTNKRHVVVMEEEEMRITNPMNEVVLIARRDQESKLFFLKSVGQPEDGRGKLLLAQSYAGPERPKQSVLWRLHLKHGHRNFADLSRLYGVPLPKEPSRVLRV